MGKGDQRSRRGKTWIGTYGKTRPRKAKKVAVAKKGFMGLWANLPILVNDLAARGWQ